MADIYKAYSNTNVGFKIGTQEALEAMISNKTAAAGCFYLTSDTHRLYVGRELTVGGSIPVAVNEGIITVANTNSLPTSAHAGEFYYISDTGVLAVCARDGDVANKWLQLNQDTKLTQTGSNATIGAVSGNASTITTTIKDTAGTTVTTSFALKGGDNVALSIADGKLVITSTDHLYQMGVASGANSGEAVVSLKAKASPAESAFATQDSITFSTDNTLAGVEVSSGKVTIKGYDYSIATVTGSNKANGFGIAVKGGHNSSAIEGTIDPIIKLGSNSDAYHFASGTATLPVYTKTEIDNKFTEKLNDFNAMQFRAVVKNAADITGLSDLHNGDVFKANGNFTIANSKNVKIGDLIIVQGTEGSNGIVSSPDYEIVPSGDENVTSAVYLAHGIQLKTTPSVGAANDLASFAVAAGDLIELSDSASSGTAQVTTISHKSATVGSTNGTAVSQSAKGTANITVVTGITDDGFGHLKSIEKTVFSVTDTHNQITGITVAASVASNVATVTTTVKTSDDTTGKSGSFQIDSTGSLTVSASGSKVTMDLVWGSF